MPITTCIFDAYGTLFDVTAAARQAAAEPEFPDLQSAWPKLANDWRNKQLQYTWLRAITDDHTNFWQVTQDGLDWALEASGLHGDANLRTRLLNLYWELAAYPEVLNVLQTLRSKGLKTGILSNGSPDMLDAAVGSAGLNELLDANISVEDVGVFKPSTKVYELVLKEFSCEASEVLFVSSNGWDVAGAAGFGFETAWANREGAPVDRLPHAPKHILSDLSSLPTLVNT